MSRAANTKRLTKTSVDALRAVGGTVDLFDTEIRGFHVRAWPAPKGHVRCRKAFRLKYFIHARQRVITLCEYGPKTTDEARRMALKVRGLIEDGIDPLEERAAEQERAVRARAESETIQQLFDRWMRDGPASKIDKRASSWATNERHFRNHLLPLLGNVEVRKLTVRQIEKAQLDIANGRTAKDRRTKKRGRSRVRGGKHIARNALLSLSAMFTWYHREFPTFLNPVRSVSKAKPRRRRVKLTREQAKSLLAKLDEAVQAGAIALVWADVLRLLLFTAGRKSEIMRLSWSEVNLAECCIELSEARDKSGDLKEVPLNTFARALLVRRRADADAIKSNAKWVFPSSTVDGPVVGLQKAWEKIRDQCGLQGVWLHDLRRTWATLAAEAGGAPATIALALGHRQIQTQSHYVHVDRDRALELADAVQTALLNSWVEPNDAANRANRIVREGSYDRSSKDGPNLASQRE